MAQTANLGLPLIDANMTADVPRDMNALANAVDTAVTEAVEGVTVPDATTTQKGIVQLNDTLTSTNKTQAATADALRRVYDEALAGKQLGVEQKANVVAALNSIGVSATTSDTWPQLIAKISGVIRATGNAVVADVLAGKTFSNASGNNLTGTMANRGAGGTVTPGTTNQTKAAGYYSSAITILGDPDLIAANIRTGVNIFGVVGTMIEGKQYASGVATSSSSTTLDIPLTGFIAKLGILWKGDGAGGSTTNAVIIGRTTDGANSGFTLTYNSATAGVATNSFSNQIYTGTGVVRISSIGSMSGTWNYLLLE
ncbi:hypothetical protein M2277_006436 [Paenibacillus sp. LBL]|uniref:phage tail protein n=1 Tax=Paenibacillus sp. LBL TaxID=2940563 RepID=UPI0024738E31|nr:phage tail protein [Paenibacillus sp. LBL]MDH6675715.1 hypothetical protein [Paenibacillus sp. LBL]